MLRSINKKNRLYKKWLKNPNCVNRREIYKKYRNILNALLKSSRKKFWNGKFNKVKGDIAATWRVINEQVIHKAL